MIFVTVGTHEQQFNRLVSFIDALVRDKIIDEEVIIQTGYSTYKPEFCTHSEFFTYQEMLQNVAAARIVITHGGPSSFIMPLQVGKIPVVVPRKKEFGEHVNNHQFEFARAVAERQQNILVVEQIEALKDCILNYDKKQSQLKHGVAGNTIKFNEELEKIVKVLCGA